MTKIAASIRPGSYEHGEDLILSAMIAGADKIELWADRLEHTDVSKLIAVSELPVIINLKNTLNGGEFTGTIYDQLKALENFVEQGAYLIDIPYSKDLHTIDIDRLSSKTILSYEDSEKTPSLDEIENLIDKMLAFNPEYIRLAFELQQEIDLMNLLKLQANRRDLWGKSIIIGTGRKGMLTRVTSSMFGHPFAFASIDRYSRATPGQITIDQLKKYWKRFGFTDTKLLNIERPVPPSPDDSDPSANDTISYSIF